MEENAPVVGGPVSRPAPGAWPMLTLLFLAYVLSLVDRMVLALLVEPIKRDLAVDDTGIALLQGLAFVLLYCAAGIPIGRAVDGRRRLRLVAGGIALWSIATASCGLAGRYATLFLARIGVGVGEATLGPATYSLLADAFPRRWLGLASSIFALGASVGAGLSLMLGGQVVEAFARHGPVMLPIIGPIVGPLQPWQTTFLAVGLPGLPLALAVALMREPARRDPASRPPPWSEVGGFLLTARSWLLPHVVGTGLAAMLLFGTTSWIIAFLGRVHGLSVGQAGAMAGLATLIGGTTGLLVGGRVSDLLSRTSPHRRLAVCAAALGLSAPIAATYPLLPSAGAAMTVWGVLMATAAVPIGVALANLQEMTPGRMRGVVSALYILTQSLIGIGLGPLFVALLSDGVIPGIRGLAAGLAWVGGVGGALGAAAFFRAAHRQRSMAA